MYLLSSYCLLVVALFLVVFCWSSVSVRSIIKHRIVESEETGTFYLIQSNAIRKHIPDSYTLQLLLGDTLRVDEEQQVTKVSENLLEFFQYEKMPSLLVENDYPDEKIRAFVQHFEIVDYPFYWTDTHIIKGYFNSAIIRWHNASLIAYRGGRKTRTQLSFSWMSDDFKTVDLDREYLGLMGRGQGALVKKSGAFDHSEEDPRMLVLSNNRLMVSYISCLNDCPDYYFNTTITFFTMNLNKQTNQIEFGKSIYLDYSSWQAPEEYTYVQGIRTVKQKNWVPFEYNGAIHFIHTFYPLQVLEVIGRDANGFGIMKYVVKDTDLYAIPWKKSFGWPIRGGTAAIKVRGVYLTIFHAVTVLDKLVYTMGALTFCAEPPFNILSMSKVPITKSLLYDGEWANSGVYYVVFPCGIQLSEDEQLLYISLGHNDRDTMVLKFEVDALLESLSPIAECLSSTSMKH